MNSFVCMGRISNDPDIRATQDGSAVVRFSFAIGRRVRREGEPDADFFNCIILGRAAENFSKLNIAKGTKLILAGEVRNNNYTDRNGNKVYSTQILVNAFEFWESKSQSAPTQAQPAPQYQQTQQTQYRQPAQPANSYYQPKNTANDGFMPIADDLSDEGLPFN